MSQLSTATRLSVGARVRARSLASVAGTQVSLPDPTQLVHLQFRRFAGCPICHLHLRTFERRHAELTAAGVREVAVFHTDAEELRRHDAHALAFPVLADPGRQLYREFGVESGLRALLRPRVWPTIVRAIAEALWRMVRGLAKPPAAAPTGGRLGLPADFLIASDGRVLACKYGEHAYDQWSVDRVLELARAADASLARFGDGSEVHRFTAARHTPTRADLSGS